MYQYALHAHLIKSCSRYVQISVDGKRGGAMKPLNRKQAAAWGAQALQLDVDAPPENIEDVIEFGPYQR